MHKLFHLDFIKDVIRKPEFMKMCFLKKKARHQEQVMINLFTRFFNCDPERWGRHTHGTVRVTQLEVVTIIQLSGQNQNRYL